MLRNRSGKQPRHRATKASVFMSFSCGLPSEQKCALTDFVEETGKKKTGFFSSPPQTGSAEWGERGEEHCVPPGGLVVGSYVRLVSAWQQSRAPLTVSHC